MCPQHMLWRQGHRWQPVLEECAICDRPLLPREGGSGPALPSQVLLEWLSCHVSPALQPAAPTRQVYYPTLSYICAHLLLLLSLSLFQGTLNLPRPCHARQPDVCAAVAIHSEGSLTSRVWHSARAAASCIARESVEHCFWHNDCSAVHRPAALLILIPMLPIVKLAHAATQVLSFDHR